MLFSTRKHTYSINSRSKSLNVHSLKGEKVIHNLHFLTFAISQILSKYNLTIIKSKGNDFMENVRRILGSNLFL